MADCLFCKMIEGTIPADVVLEDEHVLAFRDIDPQAPHHILIIPKHHIATLNDLSDEDQHTMGRLFQAAGKIATELGFSENGYRTVINCNSDGGQVVFHIHLHLLAGRKLSWPPG